MHHNNIRDATEADLPELLAILNQQIRETVYSFRMSPLDAPAGEQWFATHRNPRFPVLVAALSPGSQVSGDASVALAGWASLSPWSSYEAYHRTAEVSVWVRPEFQRQGLGRALMQALIERAGELHYRVLLSRIEAQNQGSLKLHEAFDFRVIGTMHRVGEKFGRLLDVVMLERELASLCDL